MLKERIGDRVLEFGIGAAEAAAIAMALQGVRQPRPMTHDLIGNLLGALDDVSVLRVIITKREFPPELARQLADGEVVSLGGTETFYAELELRHRDRVDHRGLPTLRWHRCGPPARRADRRGRRAGAGPRHSLRRQPQRPLLPDCQGERRSARLADLARFRARSATGDAPVPRIYPHAGPARPDPDDQGHTADEQRGHLRTSHVVIGGFVSGMDGS
jgi:Domain of unknown function (DUF151)